jgi:transposase
MIDKSKMTPKQYERWVDAANEARGAAEEVDMMNEPRFRALYGDSSAPLPPQPDTSKLSTAEAEKARIEREEHRMKYYNLRENERDTLDKFDKATYTGGYLTVHRRPPVCEKLMGDWWEMTDYGFIHAARGAGKSFFALALCHALTTGQEIAGWKIEKPVKVMYVDGEMSQQDLQKRCCGLDLGNENFRSINHDAFFRENGSVFCLSEEEDQNALLQHCYNQGVKVLVLDNLSSLFRGVEENSADDWEKILGWLLKCRRYGISVVLIHHSGKNGDQRGTSRREDHTAWSIKLDPVDQADVWEDEGAKFHVVFTKARHPAKYPLTTEWTFKSEDKEDGARINVSVKGKGLSDVVLDLIRQGVDNNGDIADHLGVSRALVTKIFHKLETKGLACKEGQRYRAGKAKKEEGPVEVNAPPIEDAVIVAVKRAGHPATFAEICDALKTVAEWNDKTVEDAVRKLAETGRLLSEDIPNPKTGKGQKKTRLAYRIP